MAVVVTPIQPLILTTSGVLPTIPSPSTIMPTDSRFDNTSDLMIGQLAYNIVDDIWYYRGYSGIAQLSSSGSYTTSNVSVWDEDTSYTAGNIYVSYVNEDSDDEQFQTSQIYRCIVDTTAGESPENTPDSWELQGTTVSTSTMYTGDILVTDASVEAADSTITTQAEINEDINESLISIASVIARISTASMQVNQDSTTLPLTLSSTEETWTMEVVTDTTDEDILYYDLTNNYNIYNEAGRYNFNAVTTVTNASTSSSYTVTIKAYDASDNSIINTRTITVPKSSSSTEITLVLQDVEEDDLPAQSYITFSCDNDNDDITLDSYQLIITAAGTAISSSDLGLDEDVTVSGIGTVGGYSDDDVIEEGTTLTEFVKGLVQVTVNPTYTNPSASLAISPSSTQEIGASVTFTLTPSFTQNDAGDLNEVEFFYDSTSLGTQTDLTAITDTETIQAGTQTWSVEISYDEGDVLQDNFGNDYTTGQIEAGTITASRSVTGAYRRWYGAYGTSAPTTSDNVRSLSYSYSSSFSYETGTVATYMVVAVPSTLSLSSVIDEDALNADLVDSFVLSSTLTAVEDGGGNTVSYNVYYLSLATPYSSSHTHTVTIS